MQRQNSAKLRLPDLEQLERQGPTKCSWRVHHCCCCVSLGPGSIAIAVLVAIETLVSFFLQDWINFSLQCLLLVIFLVTLCKQFDQDVRRCLWLAYSLVLILNFIELIAVIVVYFVINDVVIDFCKEY